MSFFQITMIALMILAVLAVLTTVHLFKRL